MDPRRVHVRESPKTQRSQEQTQACEGPKQAKTPKGENKMEEWCRAAEPTVTREGQRLL